MTRKHQIVEGEMFGAPVPGAWPDRGPFEVLWSRIRRGRSRPSGVTVRRYERRDARSVWALSIIPNVGHTADPTTPLELPLPDGPPPQFPHLADVEAAFHTAGGDFLVVERDGVVVAMGGVRPNTPQQAEVLHVRVHPATRRQGIGRTLMNALERRAVELGFDELHLDTATNQPEAVAFYEGLGYRRAGEETRPDWSWTLVYFARTLSR